MKTLTLLMLFTVATNASAVGVEQFIQQNVGGINQPPIFSPPTTPAPATPTRREISGAVTLDNEKQTETLPSQLNINKK